jgi:sarcosine oxidase subunit gamma
LHPFGLADQARASTARDGVVMSELPNLGYIVLRGHQSDEAFMARAAATLGQPLPRLPMTLAECAAGGVLWVSPDEWLLVCRRSQRGALLAALGDALQGVHAQVVDNSGGLAMVRLSGEDHVTVLRHLGTYDFESLGIGRCVSTALQKTTVAVVRTDERGVLVIFRRSYADYTWRLLLRAARPYLACVAMPQHHADPLFTPMVEPA